MTSCTFCGKDSVKNRCRKEDWNWMSKPGVVLKEVWVGHCTNCGEEYFEVPKMDSLIEVLKTSSEKEWIFKNGKWHPFQG